MACLHMSYVVTVLSWAGWIWTGVFFAVVIALLRRESALRRQRGFEVVPAPDTSDA